MPARFARLVLVSFKGWPSSVIDPSSGTSLPISALAISSWPEPM